MCGHEVADVTDDDVQAGSNEPVAATTSAMQLGHDDPTHPGVGEQGAHGEAEAEPADEDVAGAAFEHQLGQAAFGRRLDVVHDEHAVHPQLERAVGASPHHDLVCGHG